MRIEMTPAGKVVGLLLMTLGVALAAVHQAPDLRRYLKSEMM